MRRHPKRWLTGAGAVALAFASAVCFGRPASCEGRGADGAPRYERCLGRHETLAGATVLAPFTVLSIDYYKPGWGGYFSPGSKDAYLRILQGGRVVLERAEKVEPWEGLGRQVLLATVSRLGDGGLHLLDSADGGTPVRHLPTGEKAWEVDEGFNFGYPWGAGQRYLPRRYYSNDAGFLLSLNPVRLRPLPLGSSGMVVPEINTLAAVSPDGRAYAYVDSRTAPSAMMVVTDAGSRRDPIALPLTELAPAPPGTSPYEPLRSWFAASYAWQADRAGAWVVAPRRAVQPARSATDALEDLFLDATHGYRHCFAGDNPSCLAGWKRAADPEALTGSCCNSPYTYEPAAPVTAFGSRVVALSLRKSSNGSGYALIADSAPAALAESIERRLRARRIPFVRADRCPDKATDWRACERQRVDVINWQSTPNDPHVMQQIMGAAEKQIVLVTPTLALTLYPDDRGRTWILPLARHVQPPRTGKVPQPPPRAPVAVRGS